MTLRYRSSIVAMAFAGALILALIPAARAAAADCMTVSDCYAAAGLQDAASEQDYNQAQLYQAAAQQQFQQGNAAAATWYAALAKSKLDQAAWYAALADNNYNRGDFIDAANGPTATAASKCIPVVTCKTRRRYRAPKCVKVDRGSGGRGFGQVWIYNHCGVPYRNPQRVKVVIIGFPDSRCMSIRKGGAGDYAYWGLYRGVYTC